MANTKQSMIHLQRRSAGIMSRSDRGAVSDFSQSSAGPSGSAGSRFDRMRRVGRKTTLPGNGASINNDGDNNNKGGTTAGSKSTSGGGVLGVQNAPRGGEPVATPGSVGRDSSVAPGAGGRSPESTGRGDAGEAFASSGVNSAIDAGPVLSRAHDGPPVVDDGKRSNEQNEHRPEGERKEDVQELQIKTTAGKIGAFLTWLPLSKLKIVIGKNHLRNE